jgi:CO/xanthine dehydrogenase Mo-binding subunit
MTEMLNKEFSRKSFVKGGGAMIIGYGALAGAASAATGNTPFAARGPADFLPNLNTIDAWLAIRADNKVIVSHGEPEFAGTPTGILQLVAEELNMSMAQMIYASPETWLNATGGGGGSGGIATRSQQCRAAAAYAKQELLKMASANLGVPVASLSVKDGVVSGGGRSVTYGALIGGKNFNFTMPAGGSGSSQAATMNLIPGAGISKPVAQYEVVGKVFPRIDIPDKVAGKYTYVHNVKIPGMWHARWVNPRGIGANTSQNHIPISVDESSIKNTGAQVVRIHNFLAVVAPLEYQAIQAASQLKVVWKSDPKFGSKGSGNYWNWMRQAADANLQGQARYTANQGNVDAALRTAAKTVSATYKHHYNNFVPIGPHAAVADVRMDQQRATLFVQGQSLQGIPPNIGEMLGLPARNVRAIWYEGSSSYGGGQQGQAAEQAAMISKAIGKPVRLQWMRWDQHGWDSYGPSHMYDVKAGIDANGRIVAADWVSYGQAGTTIDTTRELLGVTTWAAVPGVGGPNPSDTLYAHASAGSPRLGARRVLAKTQPLYQGSLKISALRAPNAPQSYFASEQLIDELAYAAKMDPIAFRRLNIDGTTTAGARWLSVMDAATITAGWKPKVAASNLQSGDVVTGRGFAFGLFASTQIGIVADVEVNKKTGKIVAKHVYAAENNGITVGPDLVSNQTVGAVIQGLSRAMHEAPRWNAERITSIDWVTYPILRFADAPKMTVVRAQPGKYTVVPFGGGDVDLRAGNTAAFNNGWLLTGAGEPGSAGVGAAVANAFFDATGARVRQAPMTPAVVRGSLQNAGVA